MGYRVNPDEMQAIRRLQAQRQLQRGTERRQAPTSEPGRLCEWCGFNTTELECHHCGGPKT